MLVSLFNCSELYVVPESHYVIPKGKHASKLKGRFPGDKLRTLKRDRLEFRARFDETARYNAGIRNQADINKLMGFSEANSHHRKNSIRFGWRYDLLTDSIEVFAYAYEESKRWYQRITKVAINQSVKYCIQITDQAFYLIVDDAQVVEFQRTVKNKKGIYYLLFPFFGGNEVAPHDINVYVEEMFR